MARVVVVRREIRKVEVPRLQDDVIRQDPPFCVVEKEVERVEVERAAHGPQVPEEERRREVGEVDAEGETRFFDGVEDGLLGKAVSQLLPRERTDVNFLGERTTMRLQWRQEATQNNQRPARPSPRFTCWSFVESKRNSSFASVFSSVRADSTISRSRLPRVANCRTVFTAGCRITMGKWDAPESKIPEKLCQLLRKAERYERDIGLMCK